MAKRLYVGNLPFDTDEARLLAAFAQDGRKVLRVNVVMDRETNRQRGFAFVEMATEADAKLAIQAMNGADFGGRGLRVSEAEDRRPGAVPRSAAGAGAGDRGPRPEHVGGGPRPETGHGAERAPARSWGGGSDAAPSASSASASDARNKKHERKGGRPKHDNEADFEGGRRGGRRRFDVDDDDE